LLSAGPTVLVVEAGIVSVQVVGAGRIQRADGSRDEADANGSALAAVLYQGDSLTVPAGVRHTIVQQGEKTAVVLGGTLFFVSNERDSRPRGPEVTVFSPPEGVSRDSSRSRPLPEVDFLASGTVEAWTSGPVEIALGRMVLGPGGSVASIRSETVLLAVEAGVVEIDGEEVWSVAAGMSTLLVAGPERAFHNPGGGLVVALVLSVATAA
jgi:hypothetical protein